jgi:DNA-binding transcriptional ArsR family regulator
MAFDTLLWVRKQKTGNCASRSVLRVLADHAGQDHSCYLRTRLIAAETDLSEAGVRKALTRLLDAGLVRVYDRYDRTGKRISNRYQVLVDGIETPAPDAEDYADVRGVTLSEVDVPLSGVEGQTLNGGEGLPHKEASSSEAPIVKGRAAAPRTATRLPDDFMPDEKMRAWFADEKLATVIDGVTEHEKFVNYFIGCPRHQGPQARLACDVAQLDADGRRAVRYSGAPVTPWRLSPVRPGTTRAPPIGEVMQTLALAEKFRQMEEKQ